MDQPVILEWLFSRNKLTTRKILFQGLLFHNIQNCCTDTQTAKIISYGQI